MIYAIIHKPMGDTAATYEGMDQNSISDLLSQQGFTVSFVDKQSYDAFVLAHQPVPPTPAEINLRQRSDAINDLLISTDDRAKEVRSILMTLFDENNNTREWIQAFKGQVALATSLADLKARIAALPDMPDRTVQQAKQAVQQKINSGEPD